MPFFLDSDTEWMEHARYYLISFTTDRSGHSANTITLDQNGAFKPYIPSAILKSKYDKCRFF